MLVFERLLVPVDGSRHAKRAVNAAADLAARHEARIYLLHVTNSRRPVFRT
jgi:nucleotide-binding universal stress UspA family protein